MFSDRHSEGYEVLSRTLDLLLLILAGWINHRQQNAVEYLGTENQILKEKLGKKRIRPDDDQRRRLAVKGKILGRKMRSDPGTAVPAG